jgi:hypothetical protein
MDQWASTQKIVGSRYSQSFNYAIRRVSTSSFYVTTMAGKYCNVYNIANTDRKPSASCYSDGNGTVAGISKTKSETISSYLAVGKTGDKLFFTDYGNNVVRKIICGPLQAMAMVYGECYHPTYSPTLEPTEATANPTLAPSVFPASAPSFAPTVPPSYSPTNISTYNPSDTPTKLPLMLPSQLPTQTPSTAPTAASLIPPSTSPTSLIPMTYQPSNPPTQAPTSMSPSMLPSSPPTQNLSSVVLSSQYIHYPLAPNALYQPWMNVSFVSGRLGYFAETAGFHSSGVYNGVLGIAFDKTETYGFLTSADGSKVRKLDLQTTQVGLDVTRKYTFCLIYKTYNSLLLSYPHLALSHGFGIRQHEYKALC